MSEVKTDKTEQTAKATEDKVEQVSISVQVPKALADKILEARWELREPTRGAVVRRVLEERFGGK